MNINTKLLSCKHFVSNTYALPIKSKFLQKAIFSYEIENYSDETFSTLMQIALFKFGENKAYHSFVEQYDAVVKEYIKTHNEKPTIIVPITKSPLKRAIVDLAYELAKRNNLEVLAPSNISKKKSLGALHNYTYITSSLERFQSKYNYLKITAGSINTSRALILDDTIASGATLIEYSRAINETHTKIICQAYAFGKFNHQNICLEEVINLLPIWDMSIIAEILNTEVNVTTTSSRKLLSISPKILRYLMPHLTDESKNMLKDKWQYFFDSDMRLEQQDILKNTSNPSAPEVVVYNDQNFKNLRPYQFLLIKEHSIENIPCDNKQFRNSDIVIKETNNKYEVYRYIPYSEKWVKQINTFDSIEDIFKECLLWGN